MTAPYLALGLTGDQVLSLIDEPGLRRRWDSAPLAFSVLGVDRLRLTGPGAHTVESTVAASFLAAGTRHARMFSPVRSERDHPYNLARRSASIGHLSGGRVGLVFGWHDPFLPTGAPWLPADVPEPDAAADSITAVRSLEQSWPYDSVIADRTTGIFTESDRIDRVDLDGAFPIAGPLTVPEPPTGPTLLAWHSPHANTPLAPIDLTIGPSGQVIPLEAGQSLTDWPEFAEGALLTAPRLSLSQLLDDADRLLTSGARSLPPAPLRTALHRPKPCHMLPHNPAFPAPTAGVAR